MKITLIARADNTGLGSQTWEFYNAMKPHKTYVIDLTQLNASNGKITQNYLERFPDATVIDGFPDAQDVEEILKDTDVLFTVETPYNFLLFQRAKELGVKTVLQYNYEFLDYLSQPNLPLPDLLLAPSTWNLDRVRELPTKVEYLPVPTNRDRLPFRQRTEAKSFLHIAGHETFEDRNGTQVVISALTRIANPVDIYIHSQSAKVVGDITTQINNLYNDKRIKDCVKVHVISKESVNYWETFDEKYDVLLLPRKYGGLSLQLNEALSVGMPVLMTSCEPQIDMLPPQMLIPQQGAKTIVTRTNIECYYPSAIGLANAIDDYNNLPKLVQSMSTWADNYSKDRSWDTMKPQYMKLLEAL